VTTTLPTTPREAFDSLDLTTRHGVTGNRGGADVRGLYLDHNGEHVEIQVAPNIDCVMDDWQVIRRTIDGCVNVELHLASFRVEGGVLVLTYSVEEVD
jgi:hypothetical protein